MPDRSVKLNWNLFRIIRKRTPEPLVEQKTAVAAAPMLSATPSRRIPAKDEQLAYCIDCQEWTPMRWLSKIERGKKPEQWFQCEYCGGRKLTLKYLPVHEAMRRSTVTPLRESAPSSAIQQEIYDVAMDDPVL